ncbi:MAG: hypothetical protein KJ955_08100 [Nanoarchaeota archaeon]|nr:hypothetical protein [Nanoarchaeota archaeon]
MKKRVIWLFGLMLILFAANAFALEINFRDKSYPGYLFIPLLLIAVIWVVIVTMWLFRHFKGLSLFFFNVGKFVSQFGIGAGLKKLKEKIKESGKKDGEETVVKKAEIKEEEAKRDLTGFVAKVDALEKKLEKTKDTNEVLKEFGPMVKDFLTALLNIHYEFTDAEIAEVLEKKKKHLVDFAQKISDMKFSGKKVSRKEIETSVKEFKSIVHKYVETGWKPKKVARGIIERLAEQDKRILTNVKQYVDFLKHENRKKQIESLLADEEEILKRNVRSMKHTYNRILKMYVQLTPNDKAVVYPQLVEFYNNANKAIFSSVYGKKSKKELEYFVRELKRLKEMPKREPWLLRMKHRISMPSKELKIKAPKAPAVKANKKVREKVKLPSIKPLFVKLVKVFRPSEISEKRAKRMFKPKKAEKIKLKEPTLKPLLEKISSVKEIGESFKASFRERFGKKIPTITEKLIAPKPPESSEKVFEKQVPKPGKTMPEAGAIAEIGRLLEQTQTIEKVNYAEKLRQKMSEGWNLIAVSNFKAFDELYEKIKIDYVNLSKEEQTVLGPKIITLHDASINARTQNTRNALLEKEKAVEGALIKRAEAKEKRKTQTEAHKILSAIEAEFDEEAELRKEEDELLRLKEERNRRHEYDLRKKEQHKVQAGLKKIDWLFRERARLDRQQEKKRKEEEEVRFQEERRRIRLEAEKKKKEQAAAKQEIAYIDRMFMEKAEAERKAERQRRDEEKLRLEALQQVKQENTARQRSEWLIKREEERKRKDIESRKKETEKFRLQKEREIKAAMRETSLPALESLEDELRRRISEISKSSAPGENMKERVMKEAEIVRREAEIKRSIEERKRKLLAQKKRKKEDVVSPLEQEQLKLLLELERIKEGL